MIVHNPSNAAFTNTATRANERALQRRNRSTRIGRAFVRGGESLIEL
ncbi:MAG: hypothetical protein WDO17_04395 [Alphaproteobacteria bacterium]